MADCFKFRQKIGLAVAVKARRLTSARSRSETFNDPVPRYGIERLLEVSTLNEEHLERAHRGPYDAVSTKARIVFIA